MHESLRIPWRLRTSEWDIAYEKTHIYDLASKETKMKNEPVVPSRAETSLKKELRKTVVVVPSNWLAKGSRWVNLLVLRVDTAATAA